MKIIISPAKKMNVDLDSVNYIDLPGHMSKTEKILSCLKSKSYNELKKIWKCNDKIANQNFERVRNMNLYENLTPAILSYEGIAYQYMAPSIFEYNHLDYVQENLRILSAFYGVLKPMDGVVPYRLEMQAKLSIDEHKDLFYFWDKEIYNSIIEMMELS